MEQSIQIPSFTESHVSETLKKKLKSDKFKILNYTTTPLGEWVGLCGDHALLRVMVDSEELNFSKKEFEFFVKLYPRVAFVIDFIEGTGSFKKEIFIYQLFDKMKNENVKILDECIPHCYLTERNKFLVMENLTLQGYNSLNKHEVCNYDTIKVVLEALAKVHASSLIYEERISEKSGKNYRLIDECQVELEETYFNDKEDFPNKTGLQASITGVLNSIPIFNFPKKLLSGKDFRTVLEEQLNKVYDLAKPSKTYRNVVCHGDLWATNILVKNNNENKPINCRLVDFQCARYASPAQDVLSVIFLITSREFRNKYMYNLIGMYYTNLEKHIVGAGYDMKKILTFEEFLASCEEMKLFALIQTAVYFPLILLNSKEVQRYFGDSESNKKALYEDKSLLVLEYMNKDEFYKNRIQESIQDLKEYCDYL